MTLPELRAIGERHPQRPRVGPGTINKKLVLIRAVLSAAAEEEAFGAVDDWANPFAKVRTKDTGREREDFTGPELTALFAALADPNDKSGRAYGDARRFLPLLALYTGCRISELALLQAKDVFKDGGRFFFSINLRGEGKRLKTKSSRRSIPVHRAVEAAGFMTFVEGVRRKGREDAQLFPAVLTGSEKRNPALPMSSGSVAFCAARSGSRTPTRFSIRLGHLQDRVSGGGPTRGRTRRPHRSHKRQGGAGLRARPARHVGCGDGSRSFPHWLRRSGRWPRARRQERRRRRRGRRR